MQSLQTFKKEKHQHCDYYYEAYFTLSRPSKMKKHEKKKREKEKNECNQLFQTSIVAQVNPILERVYRIQCNTGRKGHSSYLSYKQNCSYSRILIIDISNVYPRAINSTAYTLHDVSILKALSSLHSPLPIRSVMSWILVRPNQ